MPDKKIFSISLSGRADGIRITVTRVIFPNGFIFYKLIKNGPVWLVNANGKWKVAAAIMPDKTLITKIINRLKMIPVTRPVLTIEK